MGKKCVFPFPPHFPLASCLHLSFSPPELLLSSPSLHRGIQSLHWERSSLKVIQNCAARCLLFLPTYRPTPLATPSTLHPQRPPFSPQGVWIPLNSGKPCSKSQPGLSPPAAGLRGCPTATQSLRGGRPGRGRVEGGMRG